MVSQVTGPNKTWHSALRRFHEDGGSWIAVRVQDGTRGFWASWADALHMIDQRFPRVSRTIVGRLTGGDAQGCLGALVRATEILDRDGFMMLPPWEELQGGKRPPPSENAEPGSGSMAGNITRLPLPSSTFGRPWSLPNHAPQTRPTCVLTQDRAPAPCCTELRQAWSSRSPGNISARWFWRGCVCHCK